MDFKQFILESNQDVPEDIQLMAVKNNPIAIEYIKNPSEEIKLAAVKRNGYEWVIKYINNPSEAVQLVAVVGSASIIKLIENPSEAVQIASVEKYGWSVRYIDNPTEKVQLVAVKEDWRAIKFIENPSDEVQLVAVNQNLKAIEGIKNPSEAVQNIMKKIGYVKGIEKIIERKVINKLTDLNYFVKVNIDFVKAKRKNFTSFRLWLEFKDVNNVRSEIENVRDSLKNILDNDKVIKWEVENRPRFASHPNGTGGINIKWNI